LWSTAINEIRLARRARIAEADYRHADITRPGESGSETPPGRILVQRGSPAPSWEVSAAVGDRLLLGALPTILLVKRIEGVRPDPSV